MLMKNMKWLLLLIVATGIFACSKVEDPKTIVLLGEEKYVKDVADINHVFDSLYKYFDSKHYLTGDSGYYPPCFQGKYKMIPSRIDGTFTGMPDSIIFEFFDQHNRVVSCIYDKQTVDTAYAVGSDKKFRTYFTVGDSVAYNNKWYPQTRGVVVTGKVDSLGICEVRVALSVVDFDKRGEHIDLDTIIGKWIVYQAINDTAIRLDTLYPCY